MYSVQMNFITFLNPIPAGLKTEKKFLVKSSEFSFISHDSLLKLNDIRTVSINRILYQQSGRIPPDSDTYKQIESLTLQKYFPTFYHSHKQNLQTIQTLSEQLQKANMDKENLQSENEQLKAEITSIKEQIENRESRG